MRTCRDVWAVGGSGQALRDMNVYSLDYAQVRRKTRSLPIRGNLSESNGTMTPDEWRTAIGAKVEEARAGRSVRSMAKRAGISEGLWRQIESGQRPIRRGEYETVNPKQTTVIAVCDALSLPRDTFTRWAKGEQVEPLAPYPSMNDADVIELVNDQLGEWFYESGPAGIPDSFLNDDDWLADVRSRSLELFAILMHERDYRQLLSQLDGRFVPREMAERGLSELALVRADLEAARARIAALEAEARRSRSPRASDG